jgi:hypothetical protein
MTISETKLETVCQKLFGMSVVAQINAIICAFLKPESMNTSAQFVYTEAGSVSPTSLTDGMSSYFIQPLERFI